MLRTLSLLLIFLANLAQTARLSPDPPKPCSACEEWNANLAPFKLYGNTYYVGTAGLSAVLVTSSAGHVLLDAALPQSAPIIDAHIRALGFKATDIKLILTSHAHFDHVGGVAALQRYTGAVVAASESSARALRQGSPTDDDPQKAIPDNNFPVVANVRTIKDGETQRVGTLALTPHFTPGHTPGSTTWTWQSCEAGRCLDIVYADSLNAVSADDFRFTRSASHPGLVDAFRKSIATVEALPCEVMVSVHPGFSGLDRKIASGNFVDRDSCKAYAATMRRTLETRIASETTR
jgi:metallo-beta-lactamase class B